MDINTRRRDCSCPQIWYTNAVCICVYVCMHMFCISKIRVFLYIFSIAHPLSPLYHFLFCVFTSLSLRSYFAFFRSCQYKRKNVHQGQLFVLKQKLFSECNGAFFNAVITNSLIIFDVLCGSYANHRYLARNLQDHRLKIIFSNQPLSLPCGVTVHRGRNGNNINTMPLRSS